MNTQLIATFEITTTRPELMRVILDDQRHYLVQTLNRGGRWVTQKAHNTEKNAVNDCANWY